MYDLETVKIESTGLWLRVHLSGTFSASTTELSVVPVNQYWELRYIVTNGLTLKSPGFIVRANDYLLLVVGKEGYGQELFGGDEVALPGEKLNLTVNGAGSLDCTIVFKRKLIHDNPIDLPPRPDDTRTRGIRLGADVEILTEGPDPTEVS